MLLQLNITNFALIEKLSISFEMGFNVFSGETGAGKSILVDAINYVLGSKFNKDFIRTGENKTYVEALFSIENEKTKKLLESLDIDYDDIVIITREVFSSGRSIIKINDKSVTLTSLKLLSSTLIDIHGQHENVSLLEHSNHINYLDFFGGEEISNHLHEYENFYNRLTEIDNKIRDLKGNDGEREKLLNYLKYQIDEINNSKLRVNEEEELNERYEVLTHAEKINNALNSAYEVLHGGTESSRSIYDLLGMVLKELKSIEKYYDKAKSISDSLQEAYYLIEQNISEVRSVKDEIYYDAEELGSINNRIYEISKLKKKYGENISDILNYNNTIQNQYNELVNSSEVIAQLENERLRVYNKCREIALNIHNMRVKQAKHLEEKVKTELSYVGLDKSVFVIEVNEEEKLHSNGCDRVQFMISTNPGEPTKPLEKVASGGELSRIMLALKTVFVDKDEIPTVIFDEIDTGISGRIAQRVAEKMFLISTNHQVFCVTHLPQIASMSDSHYLIYKEIKENKTFTNVNKLNISQKEQEVARMVGGAEVTNITIQNAIEMVKLGEKVKENILKEKSIKI
jgi:DNA repair protein RecN (Recombination protein N)